MIGLLLPGRSRKVGKSAGGGSIRGHCYTILEDQDDETDIDGGEDHQHIAPQSHVLSRMKKRTFRAYDNGGAIIGWLEAVLLGFAAIAQLYVPVVDMNVLGDMSAAESRSVKLQLSMFSSFYEDMDGVPLDDL